MLLPAHLIKMKGENVLKKFLFLILVLCLLGCSNYRELIKNIPAIEAEKATYSRSTLGSNATITIVGAKKEGNEIVIQDLHINESFPFGSVDITLQNYRRLISK